MLENITVTLAFETSAGQGVEISFAEGPNGGSATIAISVPGDRVVVSGDALELLYDLRDTIYTDVEDGWMRQLRTREGEALFTVVDASGEIGRLTLTAEGVSVSAELDGDEQNDLEELLKQYFRHQVG